MQTKGKKVIFESCRKAGREKEEERATQPADKGLPLLGFQELFSALARP